MMAYGVGGRLGLAVRVDFLVEVLDVSVHRANADEEGCRDLAVAAARGDEAKHLHLTLRHAIRKCGCGYVGDGEPCGEARDTRERGPRVEPETDCPRFIQ